MCAKYGISDQTYRVWRYRANGIKPKRQCSREEKLEILEEGYQNGICRVCAAHGIDPGTYYYWKRKFRYTKSPRRLGTPKRFDKEERLAVVKEGTSNGSHGGVFAYPKDFERGSRMEREGHVQ